MSTKMKLILLVIIVISICGVILYSTITVNKQREINDKIAKEAFAKAFYSEEAVAERKQMIEELSELVQKSKQEHAVNQEYLSRINDAMDKGDLEEVDRLMEEFKKIME